MNIFIIMVQKTRFGFPEVYCFNNEETQIKAFNFFRSINISCYKCKRPIITDDTTSFRTDSLNNQTV